MGLPADTARDCLARAAYARDRADRSRSAADREAWLRIACEWEQLAATCDDAQTVRTRGGRRSAAAKTAVNRIAVDCE